MKENKDKDMKNTGQNNNNDEAKTKSTASDKVKSSENESQNIVEDAESIDSNANLESAEIDKAHISSAAGSSPGNKKKFRWIAAGVCTAILILGLAGGALAYAILSDDDHHNKGYNDSYNNTSNSEFIGEDEAKSIALAHAGVKESETSSIFCNLDNDDRVADYDVEFWVGNMEYDYEIDAVTGEILSYDNDLENSGANSNQSSDYITSEEAKNIALKDAGVNESNTANFRCEFDHDDGQAEYEIEWRIGNTEYEYTISAIDGTIWERDVDKD